MSESQSFRCLVYVCFHSFRVDFLYCLIACVARLQWCRVSAATKCVEAKKKMFVYLSDFDGAIDAIMSPYTHTRVHRHVYTYINSRGLQSK